MTIIFDDLEEDHIPEAIALAEAGARREQMVISSLPVDVARDDLAASLRHLIEHGTGIAALDHGHLVGYLAFYGPIERFFGGTSAGAFAPLHGYAATGEDRERLIERLLQHALASLVDLSAMNVAITAYAHDTDAMRALTLNGFGIRNSDAIRALGSPLVMADHAGYTFGEIQPADYVHIAPLENGLIRHLQSTPTFLAARELTVETFLARRVAGARFFGAWSGDALVGYLKVSDEGENFYTRIPEMLNISGAYLLPEHRGHGVYDALLAHTIATLHDEGVRLLGVDFETMNPAARHFWGKYFDAYTYSYVRRIDDPLPENLS